MNGLSGNVYSLFEKANIFNQKIILELEKIPKCEPKQEDDLVATENNLFK